MTRRAVGRIGKNTTSPALSAEIREKSRFLRHQGEMYSARTAGEQQIRDATMIAAAQEAVFADKPTKTIPSFLKEGIVLLKYDTLKSFFTFYNGFAPL